MNLSQRETLVMRLLENAAERGDQCPGNAFIAGAIGAGSISAPPEVIKGLEKKGYISVQRFQRSRVVTICATGKQTAAVRDEVHWRQRKAADLRRNQLAEMVAEGMSFDQVRRTLGISQTRVSQMWREICTGLGEQAA